MTLLRIVAAVVVIAVWAAAYGKSLLVTGTPTPPAELSGLMLAVVTWLFASAARAAGGGNGKAAGREIRRSLGRWLLGSSDKPDSKDDGQPKE